MNSDKTILVTGATGHQGGASTRHLLEDGWHVRAFTRRPDSDAARELAKLGAEIVRGDLLDRESVEMAVRGCSGVHGVQTFREAGAAGEETEGRNLIDAAKMAGVEHFVYDSVIGAWQADAREPWVVTKHTLERYLRDSGLRWTILRPSSFMENMLRQKDDIVGGVLKGMDPPDVQHQYIAVDDIGRFVALAFGDPDTWLGTTTLIAGDRLTGPRAASVLGHVIGREVSYEQMPSPQGTTPRGGPPEIADIPRLRTLLPALKSLEDWARTVRWEMQPAESRR